MKQKGYWTKERCQEEALGYDNRTDFKKYSGSAHNSAQLNGWLNDVCFHMKRKKHKTNYWTKNKCHEEALKYRTRYEFDKNCNSAYQKARRNKWLDEICSHMKIIGNKYKRCIYVYEFEETKTAYVGLTYNIDQRKYQHSISGPVFNYSQNNKITKFKKLTDYIDVNEAKNKEIFYINEYKTNNWILLNSIVGGALGSNTRKWTKETCIIEAKKYKNKLDYVHNSKSYPTAIKNKWLNDIYLSCGFEIIKRHSRNYWTKEQCILESYKYDKLSLFSTESKSAYSRCLTKKWLNEIKILHNW